MIGQTLYSTVHGFHKFELALQANGCWRFVNLSVTGGKTDFDNYSGTLDAAKKEAARKLGVETLQWEKQPLGLSCGVA